MNTYQLTVTDVNGTVFRGQASALYLRGSQGDLAILAGHTPFVTAVRAGAVRIADENGKERAASVDSGMLTVTKNGTVLLAENFQWKDTTL